MTEAHHSLLLRLASEPDRWFRPFELTPETMGAGATARLLRTLNSLGLAQRKRIGWHSKAGGVPLWAYRIALGGRRCAEQLTAAKSGVRVMNGGEAPDSRDEAKPDLTVCSEPKKEVL